MNNNQMGRMLIGFLLIFFGLSFLLDQFSIGFSPVRFWPVIILAVGLYMLARKSTAMGIIMLGFGAVFLVSSLFSINAFGLLWPLVLIGVGGMILFKPKFPGRVNESNITSEDVIDGTAFFGAVSKKVVSKNFKGGKIVYMFGGFTLDLRNAQVEDGAEIVLDGLFGGGEVFIPHDVAVISDGTVIFGGWENKAVVPDKPVATIKITGAIVFGGVEIKN
ncbi:MAG: DUF5668 domain-containing protein [Candidatus Dojkabacteria bacterium]|nr:MAG: DUF5668 domain-containing protein [Candidatus Dojkabacteria bacterium]